MSTDYRNFLALSYEELEELNLEAKADRMNRLPFEEIREKRIKYLTDQKHIKAVTVLFSDLEGRLHLLDYDKKFLLGSHENLTFDGSSIRGFTAQKESDLRLGIDWSAFYWVPADVFGNGKVLVFGTVIDKDGTPYSGDLRGVLKAYSDKLYKEKGYTLNAANEIEGFLFAGKDAERKIPRDAESSTSSTPAATTTCCPSIRCASSSTRLPKCSAPWASRTKRITPKLRPASLKSTTATAKLWRLRTRFSFTSLLCRQIANNMGYTACFLPKPVVGVNGSGMHTNVSVSKDKVNLMWDPKGQEMLSSFGWKFIDRILTSALDICLILNPSVNAYRRLDPHFEAPNQIKASATDRGSMVRVPIGNSRSMRVEVRSVAPDANPYLALYSIFKTGIDGNTAKIKNLRQAERYLPDHIQAAIDDFKGSEWIAEILGSDVQGRFADLKQASANRCARDLGTFVKAPEVQFHHEIYNQSLWNLF